MRVNARSVAEVCLIAVLWLAPIRPAQAAVVLTYAAGPNFCTTGPGYVDFPFCTIPGELPFESFVVPPLLGTYTDPNFGGTVRIMTGTPYIHPYSLPSPISPNNRYLQILHRDTFRSTILNMASGAVEYDPVPFAGAAHVWDATNDDVYYYFSGAQILKHTLSTNTNSVVVNYTGRFSSIDAGGSSDTSSDNWLSFWAPTEHNICAVNLNTAATYCADYLAPNPDSRVGWGFLDYSLISKGVDSVTGKRYVFLMSSPALGAWSVNLSTGVLDFEYRGPENLDISQGNKDGICDPGEPCLGGPHADVMADSDGKQYMVTTKGNENPCELDLVTYSLSTGRLLIKGEETGGGRHRVLNLANCGANWPDFHIGCAKSTPYCVLSIYDGTLVKPGEIYIPFSSDPHRSQIMVMRGNGLEVRFLAMSRSLLFTDDSYFPQPRAAISNDGAWVVFDSDFGIHNGERVNLMATGFGPGTLPPPNPPPPPPPQPTPEPSNFTPIRVNAGGRAFTDSAGNRWQMDTMGVGGDTYMSVFPVDKTNDSFLYQYSRMGPSQYSFTVPNGSYAVTLKFCDNMLLAAGQRKFNVAINGVPVLVDFDIIRTGGARFTAVDKSFPVVVSGGLIRIEFTNGSANEPLINAIEIVGQ